MIIYILLLTIILLSVIMWIIIKRKPHSSQYSKPSNIPIIPKYPFVTFDDINKQFTSKPGILVVMSDHSSIYPTKNKIYLKNNLIPNKQSSKTGLIATTLLQETLPLNVYAENCVDFTIGIILDANLLFKSGIIKCGNTKDASSGDRGCNTSGVTTCLATETPSGAPGPATCLPGPKCDNTNPDYVDVQALCGVNCSDSEFKCNTVQWCDKFQKSEVISKYTSSDWGGWNGCVFKEPNDLYFEATIAQKKAEQKTSPIIGRYSETEWDGILINNKDTQNLWYSAILGVFHTSDPGNMCSCMPDCDDSKTCCLKTGSAQLECMKNTIPKCQIRSTETVRSMVQEYNTNISPFSKKAIKGWSLKNLHRKVYNGWNESTNFTVDIKNFLEEL